MVDSIFNYVLFKFEFTFLLYHGNSGSLILVVDDHIEMQARYRFVRFS